MRFSVERIGDALPDSTADGDHRYLSLAIKDIHADNGSEYINSKVAQLLGKLRVELTRSRPRHSDDNALADSKNGTVIRKHFGYSHTPGKWAQQLKDFHRECFNPYINYHRPCLFPVPHIDNKGKVKKCYPYEEIHTPCDKLKSGYIRISPPMKCCNPADS